MESVKQMHMLEWSPAEKSIARQVFNRALQQELAAITKKAQQKAQAIKTPDDLWALEAYLQKSRLGIDRK